MQSSADFVTFALEDSRYAVTVHRVQEILDLRPIARMPGTPPHLLGVGVDGAQCLGEIRRAGGLTVAQDEASCVVFGMPGEAVRQGHAMQVLPLSRIAASIIGFGMRGTIGGAA